jgi:hypothetical protein
MSQVDFKLNTEQQEKFNLILDETKRVYPHLMVDDISKERIKVLIAHSVINGDLPLKKEKDKENEISVDLDNLEIKD